ncbi:class I SAM-dependent methyltransferase [Haloactinospora alba]|uniref:class I SAM-dependent methyltransferase n=1 Tax=Haloactinospora alba TaxID=405555 RepID=UPI001150A1E9|nr:methyltransferase [Haloactinospora alba]
MAPHYFEPDPEATHRPATVNLVLPDLHLRLRTDRGVFSPDRIDVGTRVLLENVPAPPPTGRLLDVGCGYGPIALAMAARCPLASVLGVEVNSRAVALAEQNAQQNGLYNVDFELIPEGQPTDRSTESEKLSGPFDTIWSNPPIRVGKPALHTLLHTWLGRLADGGNAYLVVQRNLGADSLHRWLEHNGYPTRRLASRAGFRVLHVQRS